MAELQLPKGKVALIDDTDVALVNNYNSWHLTGRNKNYVVGHTAGGADVREKIYLHRLISGASKSAIVDHINKDTLDNRRQNLRIASRSENGAWNCRASKLNAIGKYKGVRAHKNKFVARIHINGKETHLGSFPTAIEAAKAYNKAAIVAFGEFASLNSIQGA